MRSLAPAALAAALVLSGCSGGGSPTAKITPSPTPSLAPTAPATTSKAAADALFARVALTAKDFKGFTPSGKPDTTLDVQSLDFCNKDWEHDSDIVAKYDHELDDSGHGQAVQETIVLYPSGIAVKALAEYAAAVRACPRYTEGDGTKDTNVLAPVPSSLFHGHPYLSIGRTAVVKGRQLFALTLVYVDGDVLVISSGLSATTATKAGALAGRAYALTSARLTSARG